MLKKFHVRNYKNVDMKEPLAFNGLNVFIGPNNSGKSNFFEAVTYLTDLFEIGFERSVRKRNYRAMLNRFAGDDTVSFQWTINTESGYPDMTYELGLTIPENNYIDNTFIGKETLCYAKPFGEQQSEPFREISCHDSIRGECSFPVKAGDKTESLNIRASVKESIFNQIDVLLRREEFAQHVYPVFYSTADSVRSCLQSWKYYKIANISIKDVKSYARLRGGEMFLNGQCDNFANVLRVIVPRHPSFKLEYVRQLQDIMPIEMLDYEIIGDKDVNLFVVMNDKRFELSELSDGAVRLMTLFFILSSPKKPKVVFIDEPELNIHPAWLRWLGSVIRKGSRDIQMFLSTHSPDLLDTITDMWRSGHANVYVFNAGGRIRCLSPNEELEGFLNDGWQLGDLYRVGDPVIGGWPW